MEIIKTSIDGVLIIEPRVFKDARGYFLKASHNWNSMRKLHHFLVIVLTSCRTMSPCHPTV